MRFFIDECISPTLARFLCEQGHDAVHPRDRARLRDPDHVVFSNARHEDRIIVTENEADFRKLASAVDLHPGLIILPSVTRAEAQRLTGQVIAHLHRNNTERPEDLMVNAALVIEITGTITIAPLP